MAKEGFLRLSVAAMRKRFGKKPKKLFRKRQKV